MLHDYAIGRSTRRCRISDRALQPGERYYSVVVPKGAEILRYEVAEAAWQGPPAEALGWWKSVVPKLTSTKIIPTPVEELLDHLAELCEDDQQAPLANLLAVHLLRKRILQNADQAESLEPDDRHYLLVHPTTNTRFLIPTAEPDPTMIAAMQSALQALLYREG